MSPGTRPPPSLNSAASVPRFYTDEGLPYYTGGGGGSPPPCCRRVPLTVVQPPPPPPPPLWTGGAALHPPPAVVGCMRSAGTSIATLRLSSVGCMSA